jgi:hypothetical protein
MTVLAQTKKAQYPPGSVHYSLALAKSVIAFFLLANDEIRGRDTRVKSVRSYMIFFRFLVGFLWAV